MKWYKLSFSDDDWVKKGLRWPSYALADNTCSSSFPLPQQLRDSKLICVQYYANLHKEINASNTRFLARINRDWIIQACCKKKEKNDFLYDRLLSKLFFFIFILVHSGDRRNKTMQNYQQNKKEKRIFNNNKKKTNSTYNLKSNKKKSLKSEQYSLQQ